MLEGPLGLEGHLSRRKNQAPNTHPVYFVGLTGGTGGTMDVNQTGETQCLTGRKLPLGKMPICIPKVGIRPGAPYSFLTRMAAWKEGLLCMYELGTLLVLFSDKYSQA